MRSSEDGDPFEPPDEPDLPLPSPAEAMPAVLGGLGVLARADWSCVPSATLAQTLVDLE